MKRYKVTGTVAVLGFAPGEEFDEQLDPKHEKRLLDSGSVEIVHGKKTRPNPSERRVEADDEKTSGTLFGRRKEGE